MRVNDCIELFNTVKEYDLYLSGIDCNGIIERDSSIIMDLKDAVVLISGIVYELTPELDDKLLNILSGEESISVSILKCSLRDWIDKTQEDINTLSKCFFGLDYEFERMILTAERCSEHNLIKRILSIVAEFAERSPSDYEKLIAVCSGFEHLWGGFDPKTGKYDHFINGVRSVKAHTDEIRWLYNNVEDYRSRKVIYGIIRFWLEFDFSYKNSIRENNYDDYFDLDILNGNITDEEVFVDCGAYNGDTAQAFFNNFVRCRRMYLYDMVDANLSKAKEVLAGHDEIIYRKAGVGSPDQAGMKINVDSMESPTLSLGEQGMIYNPEGESTGVNGLEVELVTIDEDIKERITFLKMDIEGAEINALKGAKDHIINDHPKLAICTYHHYEHLWEIPRLIRSLNPDYRLYLRYNGVVNGFTTSEHVVLAV